MATNGTLNLAFGAHHAPKPAPRNVLRLIESEAQALAVAISGTKLAYVAACIGKSRAYVSRMQTGKRPIPEKLVMPLCAATGSLLLAQYRELQAALDGVAEAKEVERLAAMLRAAA